MLWVLQKAMGKILDVTMLYKDKILKPCDSLEVKAWLWHDSSVTILFKLRTCSFVEETHDRKAAADSPLRSSNLKTNTR
jgi:hypothetical protein